MSNMGGIILSLLLLGMGSVLITVWWPYVVNALMALIPLILILAGTGTLVYSISEIKSKLDMGEDKNPAMEEKKSEEKESNHPF